MTTIYGRDMAKRKNNDGYYIAKLSKDGKSKNIAYHILVAKAFISNEDETKNEVNHKDFDRTNNNFNNLEWLSHKENVRYSIKAKRHYCTKNLYGVNNPNYGNTKLKKFYQENKDVAKILLSRKGSHNGRSKKILMIDKNGKEIKFSYIGECCQYLIDNNYSTSSVNSLRERIRIKIKENKDYKGFKFKYYE